jgi:hypothetical protein
MAAIGYTSPHVQFFDNNGDPLAGGFLYAYAAGSVDTPQDTFTDSARAVPNENPVELDSAGRAVVYLSPTPAYKFVLTDADDVVIWSQDAVSPAAVAS